MSLYSNKRIRALDAELTRLLQSGHMPSLDELTMFLASYESQHDLASPGDRHPNYVEGNVLNSDLWNAFVTSMEDDIVAINLTLDEIFDRLSDIVKASVDLISIEDNARQVEKRAARTIMAVPEADAFRVAETVDLTSLQGIDEAISDDVMVLTEAGSLTLASTSSRPVPFPSQVVTYQMLNDDRAQVVPTVFGDPAWVIDSNVARRFIAEVTSSEQFGLHTLVLELELASNADMAQVVTSFEVFSTGVTEHRVSIETTYDGSNWNHFGSSWGNHKFVISGTPSHTTKMRVIVDKNEADGERTGMFVYAFDLGEVIAKAESFESSGEFISGPIKTPQSAITDVTVHADVTKTSEQDVDLFIASDLDGAEDINDFRWIKVQEGEITELSTVKEDETEVTSSSPARLVEGTGSTMGLYGVAAIDGSIISLDAGVNQVEKKTIQIDWNTKSTPMKPGDFESATVHPVTTHENIGRITLLGGNYHRLRTYVWSDERSTITFNINVPLPDGYYTVFVNDEDVTSLIVGSAIGIGLNPGKNKIEVVAKTLGYDNAVISVFMPDGYDVVLVKPQLVAESAMKNNDYYIAQRNKAILTNFDTSGMNLRIVSRTTTPSGLSGLLRVRARLRTNDGGSPIVRNITVAMGT